MRLALHIFIGSMLVALIVLIVSGPSKAEGTVSFTDETGATITSTEPLPADGRFGFRIETKPKAEFSAPIQSVGVTDDTGQMQPMCIDMTDAMTVSATSEVVVAVHPLVTVTSRSYAEPGCGGQVSPESNPILIEFIPEPPGLFAPLPE